MSDATLSPELQRRIGIAPERPSLDTPVPTTPLDAALHWVALGYVIFPGEQHIGTPCVNDWATVYKVATNSRETVIAWWTNFPCADIGCFPCKSTKFVISACAAEGGIDSLKDLEDEFGPLPACLSYKNRWGDRFLFFEGKAYTSHHQLGGGLHVLGAGMPVFLPPSYVPHLSYGK